ncbi:MAG: hypothetical protein ACTSRU_13650 [Candidatus Hodarchaeales archaeon]
MSGMKDNMNAKKSQMEYTNIAAAPAKNIIDPNNTRPKNGR